jgi:hypothetical protein
VKHCTNDGCIKLIANTQKKHAVNPFGITDAEIAAQTGGIATRHDILANVGTVIINKPVLAELRELRPSIPLSCKACMTAQ